jgi:ribosomal-protein-alanine N-acetyltransferase
MTLADLDRVLEIAASLKEAPRWPRPAYLAALDPQAAPKRIALVAEYPAGGTEPPGDGPSRLEAGVVAGFAVASLLPPEAELESIAVAPALQRRGLALQLFRALVDGFRLARIDEVLLELRASNRPALGLYRTLGFVDAGRRSRYYQEPVEDAVLLRLGL